MILYPHEFDLYSLWIRKIGEDMERIIISGIKREQIEAIKIKDYSNDTGTVTKAYATIEITGKFVVPANIKPTSIKTYKNNMTNEEITQLNYVLDVDVERGV